MLHASSITLHLLATWNQWFYAIEEKNVSFEEKLKD